jgi:hypothetical protein
MPLPPAPSDTDPSLPSKPDTSGDARADARVRAHMIGAPGSAVPARPTGLARIAGWLRDQLFPRR